MNRTQLYIFTIMVAVLAIEPLSLAEIQFYTDRNAWEAETSGSVTETFDSVLPYVMSSGLNSAGQIQFELVNMVDGLGFNTIDNGFFAGLNINQSPFFRGNLHQNDPDAIINLIFPYPVVAFSGDFMSTHSSDTLILEVNGMQYDFEELIPSLNGDGFLGLISTSPFTSLTLFDPVQHDFSNNIFRLSESFGLDNVSYAEIPEPITFSLLCFGLLMIKKQR